MNIVYCEKCGGYTPECFILCPPCMRKSGADENEVSTAAAVLEVATIINMGDTDASQRAAIESILKVKNRLEGNAFEEKEKIQAPPPQEAVTTHPAPRGQSSTTADCGN